MAAILALKLFRQAVPQLTLVAGTTVVTGVVEVQGGKVGYVVDQFINKLGETLEEGVFGGNRAEPVHALFKVGRKSKKTVIAAQAFTVEEM